MVRTKDPLLSEPETGQDAGGTELSPELLLERILSHFRQRGLGDRGLGQISLRKLATTAGTSHRMLTYHLGSRDMVLGEVMRALRREESAQMIAAAVDRRDAMERTWTYFTSEKNLLEMRLFFYLAGHAVDAEGSTGKFTDAMVTEWSDILMRLGVEEGVTPARARAEARLLVAAARGLMLDRLLTEETADTDAAFNRLLDSVLGQAKTQRSQPVDQAPAHSGG